MNSEEFPKEEKFNPQESIETSANLPENDPVYSESSFTSTNQSEEVSIPEEYQENSSNQSEEELISEEYQENSSNQGEEELIPLVSPENSINSLEELTTQIPLSGEENPESASTSTTLETEKEKIAELQATVKNLQTEKNQLETEINQLKAEKTAQIKELNQKINSLVTTGLTELEQKKQSLLISIEELERRRERIQQEMRTSFAGVSQELAIRVQGFKDYLVGSLQDLAAAAEQLELYRGDTWETSKDSLELTKSAREEPDLTQQISQQEKQKIKKIIEQYRTRPDYYGPPWQLRRTFEPIHAERVENWFTTQGKRGAMRSMGSRLQNILVASAAISILYQLHGDRLRTLVLADTPERLGEWRRGLQDCLGISRSDFGPNRGLILFETPEAVTQKAERIIDDRELPFIIIDEMEEQVNLSLLQFPLWLAFAPEPQSTSNYMY